MQTEVSLTEDIVALRKLSPGETRAFLDGKPALLGVIGTLSEDGYPHLVAVWYRYDGERIHVWTLESRSWVQHIVRDNRVGFSVQAEGASGLGASIKGRAAIATGTDERIEQEIRRITRRYVAEECEVEPYVEAWKHLRTIVSITPQDIRAWRDVS